MARTIQRLSTLDTENPNLQSVFRLVGTHLETTGALAGIIVTVIVCMAAFYFTFKTAFNDFSAEHPFKNVAGLMPDFILMFIPAFGLAGPLSRFRAIERWLLFWDTPAGLADSGRRKLLAPALIVGFDIYLVCVGILCFWPTAVLEQQAWELAEDLNLFLIASAALAFICGLLGATYLILIERNVRRSLREGRNRLSAVFE